MTRYPCRRCSKPKPAEEVLTRFTAFNSPIVHTRFHMCAACRLDVQGNAVRNYRKRKKLKEAVR